MWTSSRSSRRWAAISLLIATNSVAWAAGPITSFSVNLSGSSTGIFTVGVATNSVAQEYLYILATSGGTPPTAGQVMRLQLLDNGTPVSGGISPATITTNGIDTLYGGGPGLFVPITLFRASTSLTLRVTTTTVGGTPQDSVSLTALPAAPSKLLVIAPGMSHTPGQDASQGFTGYSGSPNTVDPSAPFSLNVLLTDVGFNTITTQNSGTVSFLGPVAQVSVTPPSQPWVGGSSTFTVVIDASKVTKPLPFTTAVGSANGSVSITTVGPDPEEAIPYPSPFNPTQRSINFQVQLNEAKTFTLHIKDQFGQDVWHSDVSGSAGLNNPSWDGRNEKGNIVAAGVYYILLEVDGVIKSKKRFGVVK